MKLKELAGDVRNVAKKALLSASESIWRAPLSRAASIDLLKNSVVSGLQSAPVHLPPLASANVGPTFHPEETRSFRPDYVWQICTGGSVQALTVCRSGGVLVNKKWLLDLDFTSTAGLLDSPIKKRWDKHPLIIAPWSHFWKGFYDYTIFVIAKLCRIESVYGPQIWQQAKVCYPLQHTRYERELLQKLGIPDSAIIDTAPYWGTAIEADCVIVANNHKTWCASPDDLRLLRDRLRAPAPDGGAKRKIYLMRKGRRQVRNEAAVVEMLRARGFDIIEDQPYSIDEQIRMFQNAAVVVAPHGAALTNILWCDAGTKLLEFFAGGYTPNYYYYMSAALGLTYDFLVDYSDGPAQNHWANVADDITVDTAALAAKLEEILAPDATEPAAT